MATADAFYLPIGCTSDQQGDSDRDDYLDG
jgi:hypothetical protein